MMSGKTQDVNVDVRKELDYVKHKTSRDIYSMLEAKFGKTKLHKTV